MAKFNENMTVELDLREIDEAVVTAVRKMSNVKSSNFQDARATVRFELRSISDDLGGMPSYELAGATVTLSKGV